MDTPVNEVIEGDLFDVLPDFSPESVDAVVTDPPYYFDGLLGAEWDEFDGVGDYQQWCQRWAEECFRVMKPGAHLLAFGGNRQHHRLFVGIEDAGFEIRDTMTFLYGNGLPKSRNIEAALEDIDSERAERYSGFGTQLKPGVEFVVVARKPIAEDTMAENVAEHGTGALNIDACRVESPEAPSGRHPANVSFDETAADMLDEQSGERSHGHWTGEDTDGYGEDREYEGPGEYGDTGGASRFFYTSKASSSERTIDGLIENEHVSVKPLDLMEYLVRLVTTPEQVVLDPFAGTGTTLRACKNEHRRFIGIERESEWAEIARARVGLSPDDPESLLADDDQTTLDRYG